MTAINRDKHDTPDLNCSSWIRCECTPPCAHARVCRHHGTQIFLASCLLLAKWSSNTAGPEMLSWGLTQASKVKVKLGFKVPVLVFPKNRVILLIVSITVICAFDKHSALVFTSRHSVLVTLCLEAETLALASWDCSFCTWCASVHEEVCHTFCVQLSRFQSTQKTLTEHKK